VGRKFRNVDMLGRSEYAACFSGVPEGLQFQQHWLRTYAAELTEFFQCQEGSWPHTVTQPRAGAGDQPSGRISSCST